MAVKICRKCKEAQPEESFYLDSRSSKKRRLTICKKCFNKEGAERTKAQYGTKKALYKKILLEQPERTKQCRICKGTFKIKEFIFHVTMADLLSGECKGCRKKITRVRLERKRQSFSLIDRSSLKTCKICKKEKPLFEFNAHFGKEDYHRSMCKECQKKWSHEYYKTIAVKERKRRKIHRTENPDQYRNSHYKRNFGITLKEYRRMLKSQSGKCAICGNGKIETPGGRRLSVDHDHKTGKVRALLCGNCNAGLGIFMDNSKLLHKAISYLETF